jgi:hypothetical protein
MADESKPGDGSNPNHKDTRLERQAKALRENLIRRKEQARARSARRSGSSEPVRTSGQGRERNLIPQPTLPSCPGSDPHKMRDSKYLLEVFRSDCRGMAELVSAEKKLF